MLKAISKLSHYSLLLLLLAACNFPRTSPQAEPRPASGTNVNLITAPSPSPTAKPSNQENKQKAHLAASARFAKNAEREPTARPVIQSLRNHPQIASQMFETCYDYFLDGRPNGITKQEREKLDEEMTLRYSQRFVEDVKGSQIYAISATQSLIKITCLVGPYWVATVNYLYSYGGQPQAKLLSLILFEEESGKVVQTRSTIVRGFSRFDPKTGEFKFTHKFRGPADCGFAGTYQLENDELVLQEFRAQYECNGRIKPGDYPRIYP
jgi:hypothetical protein